MSAFAIAGRAVGPGEPVYLIAELSSSHLQSYDRALRLIREAAAASADCVKIQCYSPEDMTRPGLAEWHGVDLYTLYHDAAMPWRQWLPGLLQCARAHGLGLIASVFAPEDAAVLAEAGVDALKVASFEMVDLPLIQACAATGLPLILSTGMATYDEIVAAIGVTGKSPFALLKCTSAYPAPIGEANLWTLPRLAYSGLGGLSGLSDHTRSNAVVAAAVVLGASIVERHFTFSRANGGPDAGWSDEPDEFADMVQAVRQTEAALGQVRYGPTAGEAEALALRRSLWVVADVRAGEPFTAQNVRSLRPAGGLAPSRHAEVLQGRAACDVAAGTALQEGMVAWAAPVRR